MAANLQPYSLFGRGSTLPSDLGSATVAYSTTHVQFGRQAVAVTPTATSWGVGTGVTNIGTWAAVTAASVYSLSAYIWTSLASMKVGTGTDWYNSSNTFLSSTAFTGVALTQNAFTRITNVNLTAPAGAAWASIGWTSATTWTVSSVLWISAVKIEQAATASTWTPGPNDEPQYTPVPHRLPIHRASSF